MPLNSLHRLRDNSAHALIAWLFLRGLALIYLAAFASMTVQIEGLIGENGVLPIKSELTFIERYVPGGKFVVFPTLFWFDASDRALLTVCFAGMIAAVMLLFNVFDRIALIFCYGLYLSIMVAGQNFTAFQWDAFLLEAGFLALFLTWGSPVCIFLYRFLIARFMLMGGIVKLASGDPSWANLSALSYHYQTQPLPSPVAYYAYFLPSWFHQFCVVLVFVIELIMPFLVFLPRRFRLTAAWSFILLQSAIILTGNYNFFNLLTILLCLFLFDDKDVEKKLPHRLVQSIQRQQIRPGRTSHVIAMLWAGLVLLTCAVHIRLHHVREPLSPSLKMLVQLTSVYSVINNYGPFAIMTTERPEIIVQGSNDGSNWRDYSFKYKPMSLEQKLGWNIPHQPRLDWQMWFAAMETPTANSWFARFMLKLQQGSPQVLSLLAGNPFPDHPPRYLRALSYRYFYSTPEQRAATGRIWQRQYLGVYWPSRD